MKKLLAIAAAMLAVVFLVAPGTVSATIVDLLTFQSAVDSAQAVDPTLAAPANDGGHDFAVGGFERASGAHTGFSAQSGPLGENPSGHLSSTLDPGVFQQRYDVTCLAVAGNHASIGLVPSNAGSNDATLETVLVVVDSGLPGGTGDVYGFIITPGVQAQDCPLYVAVTPPFMPLSGNILVHDELP
jgi:hypothetical protein